MIGSQQKTSESRKCFFVLFLMAGLVVLRCFEIPLTEAEPRKGRELLAKRGEQKIRKNQVQAICHSLVVVATSRIVGHRPKTANTSAITRNFLIQISNSAVQGTCDLKDRFLWLFCCLQWTNLVVWFYYVQFGFPKPGRLNLTSNFRTCLNVRMWCQVEMMRAKKKPTEEKKAHEKLKAQRCVQHKHCQINRHTCCWGIVI